MNEKSRPVRRPFSTTSAPRRIVYGVPASVVEDALAGIVWIREDATPFEAERALADLEDDLVAALTTSASAKAMQPANVCLSCGLRFPFPGRLSDHMRHVHGEEE